MDIILQEKILKYLRKNYYIDESGYGSLLDFESDDYPYICKKVLSYIKRGKTLEDCIQCYIEDWDDSCQVGTLYEIKNDIITELLDDEDFGLDNSFEEELLVFLFDRISTIPSYEDIYEVIRGLDLYIHLFLDSGDHNCEFTPNGDIIKCIYDREFEEIDGEDINKSSLVWLLDQHGVRLKDVDDAYSKIVYQDNFKRDKNSLAQDIAWEINNTMLYRTTKLFYKIKMNIDDYVKLKSFWYGSEEFFEDNTQLSGNYLMLPKGTKFGFGDDELGWSSISEASTKKEVKVPVEMVNDLFLEKIEWKQIMNVFELGLSEIGDEDILDYSILINL